MSFHSDFFTRRQRAMYSFALDMTLFRASSSLGTSSIREASKPRGSRSDATSSGLMQWGGPPSKAGVTTGKIRVTSSPSGVRSDEHLCAQDVRTSGGSALSHARFEQAQSAYCAWMGSLTTPVRLHGITRERYSHRGDCIAPMVSAQRSLRMISSTAAL